MTTQPPTSRLSPRLRPRRAQPGPRQRSPAPRDGARIRPPGSTAGQQQVGEQPQMLSAAVSEKARFAGKRPNSPKCPQAQFWPHNPKVAGSNPAAAIGRKPRKCGGFGLSRDADKRVQNSPWGNKWGNTSFESGRFQASSCPSIRLSSPRIPLDRARARQRRVAGACRARSRSQRHHARGQRRELVGRLR